MDTPETMPRQHNGQPHTTEQVSIVIPCYNGEQFVGDAIASALAQSYSDIEVIVVDDASSDNSAEAIWAAASHDHRVKLIFLEKNRGPATARNEAFAAATGDWITLLDADDLYEPDRIERLLALARVTAADVVVDNLHVRDFDEETPPTLAFNFLRGTVPVPISPEFFFELGSIIGAMNPGYLKPMFRREFLERHDIRYRPQYRVGEDFFLYAECLCRAASFYGTSHAGYIFRTRPTSLSSSGGWSLHSLARMSDEIIAEFGPQLSRASRTALKRRRRILDRYARLSDVRENVGGQGAGLSVRTLAGNLDLITLAPSLLRKRLPRRPAE